MQLEALKESLPSNGEQVGEEVGREKDLSRNCATDPLCTALPGPSGNIWAFRAKCAGRQRCIRVAAVWVKELAQESRICLCRIHGLHLQWQKITKCAYGVWGGGLSPGAPSHLEPEPEQGRRGQQGAAGKGVGQAVGGWQGGCGLRGGK